MALERIAALIWRFIGLGLIVASLPGVVTLSAGMVSSIGSRDAAPLIGQVAGVVLIATIQIIVGATIIRFSDRLGMTMARGL